VGFTPDLVAVVWIGFDEPRSVGLAERTARCRSGAASSREEIRAARCAASFPRPRRSSARRSHRRARSRSSAVPSTAPSTSCPVPCPLRSAPTGTVRARERIAGARAGFFEWLRDHF
jgi:membrane peptidoglycan carboxypeptidase